MRLDTGRERHLSVIYCRPFLGSTCRGSFRAAGSVVAGLDNAHDQHPRPHPDAGGTQRSTSLAPRIRGAGSGRCTGSRRHRRGCNGRHGRGLSELSEGTLLLGAAAGCGESPDSCSLGYSLRTGVACCRRHGIQARPLAVGSDVAKEEEVSVRSIMKFVRGGAFAAEVNVEILEEERSWAPYLSLEDAYKLDDVRDALRAGDIDRASRLAERVYRLTPVGVSGETTGGTDDVKSERLN